MSTTSSFRADTLAFIALSLAIGACSAQRGERVDDVAMTGDVSPPDAPQPALPTTVPSPRPSDTVHAQDVPVELRSASARSIARDTAMLRLAGRRFTDSARDPLVIEVVTQQPLGRLDRTSSPEIFLNGERVGDTYAIPPDRLLVFLPNRGRLRAENLVAVAWLGSEPRTMSRRPLSLRAADVRR